MSSDNTEEFIQSFRNRASPYNVIINHRMKNRVFLDYDRSLKMYLLVPAVFGIGLLFFMEKTRTANYKLLQKGTILVTALSWMAAELKHKELKKAINYIDVNYPLDRKRN